MIKRQRNYEFSFLLTGIYKIHFPKVNLQSLTTIPQNNICITNVLK